MRVARIAFMETLKSLRGTLARSMHRSTGMRKQKRPISLNRETLRYLDRTDRLRLAAGGVGCTTICDSINFCPSIDSSCTTLPHCPR